MRSSISLNAAELRARGGLEHKYSVLGDSRVVISFQTWLSVVTRNLILDGFALR